MSLISKANKFYEGKDDFHDCFLIAMYISSFHAIPFFTLDGLTFEAKVLRKAKTKAFRQTFSVDLTFRFREIKFEKHFHQIKECAVEAPGDHYHCLDDQFRRKTT